MVNGRTVLLLKRKLLRTLYRKMVAEKNVRCNLLLGCDRGARPPFQRTGSQILQHITTEVCSHKYHHYISVLFTVDIVYRK